MDAKLQRAALFLVLLALLACKRGGRSEPSDGTAPIERYARSDGTISAPKPVGDGWECLEQSDSGQGAHDIRLIKCRRTASGQFFFMLAKTYAVAEAEVQSPEQLANGPFQRNYEKLFDTTRYQSRRSVDHAGRRGYEVSFDAEHSQKGSIRKLERVLTEGTRVFIVSAEGRPADYERFAAERTAWLDGVKFSEL
jgi:hypothetical protein